MVITYHEVKLSFCLQEIFEKNTRTITIYISVIQVLAIKEAVSKANKFVILSLSKY